MKTTATISRPTTLSASVLVIVLWAVATAAAEPHAAGLSGGLIVYLGCGDGEQCVELADGNDCVVHGWDTDESRVAKARESVRRERLSHRVWIDCLASDSLPYAEAMVNLCVVQDAALVSPSEIDRVLVPGGIKWVRSEAGWQRAVKPWPAEIDEWTHWLHGADGNAVAEDLVAGPPRRLKWMAAPLWSRSHDTPPSVTSMVSASGRLFAIVDEAPASMSGAAPDKWSLVARDAFNGLKLWQRPIDQWGWQSWATDFKVRFTIPTHMPRRLVAMDDRVYVTLGFNAPLSELDAASGRTLRVLDDTENTDEILCLDNALIVAINQGPQAPGDESGDTPAPLKKWVAAIDRTSGEMLWKTGDYVGLRSKTGSMQRISHLSMVAGGRRAFFVDGERIVSLDLTDGGTAWQIARPKVAENLMRYNIRITDMCSLVYHDGMVYFAQLDPDRGIDWREIRGRVHAFSAASGEELWSRECSSWGWAHPADLFVIDGLVWVSGFKDDFYYGLDRRNGIVRRKLSNRKAFENGHHHRCYRNKATPNFLMTSFRGLEFIDTRSGETDRNHWVRGTCRLGAIPCNGMIYANPHPCDCYISSKLNGFLGLLPAEGGSDESETPSRLHKGPAYGLPLSAPSSPTADAWPTYRHDSTRSGRATCAIPTKIGAVWARNLKQRVTAPVVAGDRVVAALADCREVISLDAATGEFQWRFTAGGRIDTPSTLDHQRVLFGSADGHVYCLRASDGALIWRFLAAPRERWVSSLGHLESAWPVHGSVLVRDGVAYFTAGRSSLLDGGIRAWAVDVDTGAVLKRQCIASAPDVDVDWGRDQSVETGVLSDLLVEHGNGIYLRHHPILDTEAPQRVPRHLRATGGMLDESWFHRTRWFLGGAPMAEYLVFNDAGLCGVRARQNIGGYGGHFTPGSNGYELFAAGLVEDQPRKPPLVAGITPRPPMKNVGRPRGGSDTPKVRAPNDRWATRIAVRPTAMALGEKTLLLGGWPDELVEGDSWGDPWAAYEGRRGGRLLTVSVADGSVMAETTLPSPPVLDGIAVAGGRIYVATADGRLLCLGER